MRVKREQEVGVTIGHAESLLTLIYSGTQGKTSFTQHMATSAGALTF